MWEEDACIYGTLRVLNNFPKKKKKTKTKTKTEQTKVLRKTITPQRANRSTSSHFQVFPTKIFRIEIPLLLTIDKQKKNHRVAQC